MGWVRSFVNAADNPHIVRVDAIPLNLFNLPFYPPHRSWGRDARKFCADEFRIFG
jgi:hypothetical protein